MNTAGVGEGERNPFRTSPDKVREDNFGVVRVSRNGAGLGVELEIRDVEGRSLLSRSIRPGDQAGEAP